jgi:hypothetical protein
MPKSVMEHQFSQVPRADIPRSTFNRSHGHKTTFDADYLIPIMVDEVLPGDTFTCNTNFVCRLASPTVLPLMDNLYLETFAFYVPYRLLWDNWERFNGAQDNPADSIDYTIPKYGSGNADLTNGTEQDLLADYMGLPYVASFDMGDASALPFRAYVKIWNEWFRDQNLQDSEVEYTDNGPDGGNYNLLKRGKRHDYFTSSLPWPQKGTAVEAALSGNALVEGLAKNNSNTQNTTPLSVTESDGATQSYTTHFGIGGGDIIMQTISAGNNTPAVWANLETAAGLDINDLRLAMQTQKLLERDARAGTRYTETIAAHFGVTVPDYRVQRPEFLGGGSSRINVTPVAQTTYQGTQTIEDAKGALSGIGMVAGNHSWTKSFVEHGIVMILANVRGDITYSQGLERFWSRETRYDFFYPVLAQIGEQAVLNKEIYYQNLSTDESVWGYQERYAEYRYKPSRLSNHMRPQHSSSLDAFHLSEQFMSAPSLNSGFIVSSTGTPLDRAVSVPTEPHFIGDFYFDMKCARPMPLYGVPGNMDRF